MGLFFRKTAPSADLVEDGVRGKATVTHVEENRFGMEVNVRRGKVDDILSGESSPIRKKLTLRVELPGREPYTVETKVSVPVMKANWVFAGSIVEVLVDPKDPESLAIDWNGAHEQGSAAAAIMDSPYAVEALKGMGLDPEQIARQADDARAQALAAQQEQPPPEPGPSV
jgi:hypothetical protein